MYALLVGLRDVVVVGVREWPSSLRIVIGTTAALLGAPTRAAAWSLSGTVGATSS